MNSCELLMIETKINFASYCFNEIAYNMKVRVSHHRMGKRKSFVFARQYRNCFSGRINTLGDARFLWLENTALQTLLISDRNNPILLRNVTPGTCSKT